MPKKGDIAICQNGDVGLILDGPIKVEELGGKSYEMWRGIHLSTEKLGKNWLSKAPRVIGNIHEFVVRKENA